MVGCEIVTSPSFFSLVFTTVITTGRSSVAEIMVLTGQASGKKVLQEAIEWNERDKDEEK